MICLIRSTSQMTRRTSLELNKNFATSHRCPFIIYVSQKKTFEENCEEKYFEKAQMVYTTKHRFGYVLEDKIPFQLLQKL